MTRRRDVSVTVDAHACRRSRFPRPWRRSSAGSCAVSVEFVRRATRALATSPTSAISATAWDTDRSSADGVYTITASSTDAAGNTGTAQRTVTVDNHAPGVFTASAPSTVAGGPQLVLDAPLSIRDRRTVPDPAQRPRRARPVRRRDQRLDRPRQPSRPRHVYLHGPGDRRARPRHIRATGSRSSSPRRAHQRHRASRPSRRRTRRRTSSGSGRSRSP